MSLRKMASDPSQILTNAQKFINFLNKSPTQFHVVDSARALLKAAGYVELKLSDQWSPQPLGKYFVTKNQSTLVAFALGGQYVDGNGFSIVGAHTDSPCLKLKLISKRVKAGYLEVGVECYGGGIWHTWFDRDLSIAGRVLLRRGDGKFEHRLVAINKPLMRIPNLAIHLDRDTNTKFAPNKETHLVPILATVVQEKLFNLQPDSDKKDKKLLPTDRKQIEKHHSILVELISKELNVSIDDISDLELQLFDAQPACIGGIFDEFIFGARLDNQVGAYCTISGLIEASQNIDAESGIRMAALYDHEEIGSESAQGAASALTEHIMRRLTSAHTFELAVSRSFLISADQAHAVHPNYEDKHEDNHKPTLHGGVVLKYNGNQRYATNTVTASILREAARMANVPIQDFMVKNDCACGSTIGPIMSAKLAMETVDVGTPQLSMHSIRETGSCASITQLTDLLASFYNNFTGIRASFSEFM
jgi:aspartyl aminopeptidase